MDRRHRALLSLTGGGMLWALAGTLPAQQPPPAVSATPWVQASPPPGLATPTPAPRPAETTPSPKPPKPPKAPKPPKEMPPSPAATATPDDLARQMMQRRAAEQRAIETRPREPVHLDQLPPEERADYQRNLPLWRQLPADERDALRRRAGERARLDLEQAYRDSGLNLDRDQREMFDLRYLQERRKLERELQEKINVERARRLAEVGARLKQEFADKPAPAPTVNADALKPPGN